MSANLTCSCFPHVINICVQHVLAAFKDDALIDEVPDTGHSSWKKAACKKTLSHLRALICAMCASGRRCKAFFESIHEGNLKKLFIDPEVSEHGAMRPVHVPENALLHNVPTCWDSMYHMISRAHSLCPVIFFLNLLLSFSDLIVVDLHRLLRHFKARARMWTCTMKNFTCLSINGQSLGISR